MPDLHQSAQSQSVKQEFNSGRESVRPTISNIDIDEDVRNASRPYNIQGGIGRDSVRPIISSVEADEGVSPTSVKVPHASIPYTAIIAPSPKAPPRQQDDGPRSRPRRSSPDAPKDHAKYYRSRSQPPVARQRQPPSRQRSGDDVVSPTNIHGERQYVPYRKESTQPISPSSPESNSGRYEQFSPPSRQSSGHSGRLLPYRQGSASSDRRYNPPRRQGSGESDLKYIPYRQGSGDSIRKGHSQQNSGDGRSLSRNSPSPQHPTVFPMMQSIRGVSPESINSRLYMDTDQNRAIGPQPTYSPQPSPMLTSSFMERSSSAASDATSIYSIGGTRPSKPTFNFSRPLSKRPSIDSQHRPSIDTSPSTPLAANTSIDPLPTPVSFTEEPADMSDTGAAPAPSYIYSRFILPRGRSVERDSIVFQDSHPMLESLQQNSPNLPSKSAMLPTSSTSLTNQKPSSTISPKVAFEYPEPDTKSKLPAPSPQSLRVVPQNGKPPPGKLNTVKDAPISPRTPHAVPAANMSPDEHLDVGIELHEKGSLQESTYHLRCAAHGGHPTGMLLYALACRHGWGMRSNQREGVSWLKKVTQIASGDVAELEKNSQGVAFIEKQAHRAQFALSIYELGVSHLNGWGTEMDKGLALNCFEIAGKWGDPDALSETGFCYANAVGCKKDLKKAAKYYRMAEAKGVNMVGNSWIWKDKYLDEEDKALKNKKSGKTVDSAPKKDGGAGLFSRKKSTA
ncbi:hypothetical protein EDC01DRAFT_625366 [Geopyxis carbonaria]|nr:hypothetical protein EDC01DRAFT_625366 [Geopyxis carbonaria]